jgi:hypothetical protein
MSSPVAYDAFYDRLTSAWSTTPLVFENEQFQSPDVPAPFVFVEIFGDEWMQESLGAPQHNMFLEAGVTYLHVMVPNDTGSRVARGLAMDLLNLFREQVTDEVYISEMSIGAGEPGQDFPNYWALAATLHWYRRDITSITI